MSGFTVTATFKLLDQFSAAAAKIEKSISSLKNSMKSLSAQSAMINTNMSSGISGMGVAAAVAEGKIAKHAAAVDHTTQKVTAATKAANLHGTAASSALNSVGGAAFAAGSKLGPYGRAVALAGVATGMMVNYSIQLESKMANVNKVMELTPKALEDIKLQVLELSKTMPLATLSIADMVAQAGQLGIAESELMGFVNLTARMAVAFDMTTEQAAEGIGAIKTITSLTVPQLMLVSDAINMLGNTTNAKEKDILNFTQRIMGMAGTAKFSTEQAAAFGATLISTKMIPQKAATGMSSLISAFTVLASRSTAEGKRMTKALKSIGISSKELAKDMQTDAGKAILNFFEKLEKASPSLRGKVLIDLFGKQWQDEMSTLSKALPELRKNLDAVAKVDAFKGSTLSEYNKKISTTESSLQRLKNAWFGLGVAIGDNFPTSQVLESVTALIIQLQKLPPILAKIGNMFSTYIGNPIKEHFERGASAMSKTLDMFSSLGSWFSEGMDVQKRMENAGNVAAGGKAFGLDPMDMPKPANGKVDVNVKVSAAPGVGVSTSVSSEGEGLKVGKTSAGSFSNN